MTNDLANNESGLVTPEVQEQEKLLTQSEVNEIAGKARQAGYERGVRESGSQAQNIAQGALTEEQVRKMIEEQTLKVQQEAARNAYAQQLIGDFSNKMQTGSSQYEDFEQKVSALELHKIPEIIQLATGVDNTVDVMYELANKPYKVGNLLNLARTAPHLAGAEMNRLSNSIKENKKAAQAIQTPEPISQMKPTSGTADQGTMSVSSLRRQPWLKR